MSIAKSILVVDDQEDERAIQRSLLEHLGYRVTEAIDGVDALDRIAELAPDLVLLDIAMPRLDGLSVCRTLRERESTVGLPVLFYTASPSEEWEDAIKRLTPCGVLVKPVDPHQVALAVEGLIGPPRA